MPKSPDKINDGTKLALFLKEIKVKQLTIAQEMKIPASTMGRYVSGISKTPQKVIDHLYKKYNLNLHWWQTGKGTKVKDAAAPRGLIVDIGMLSDKIEQLTARIDNQDKVIKKLISEIYELKSK